MPAAVVLAVVVAAVNSSGVMDELSGQQRQHGLVGVAADTGVQPDVGPGYGSLLARARLPCKKTVPKNALRR